MQQVKRIISVLEILADSAYGIGLTDLSVKISLPKSTTCRILKALMEYNMVTQDTETRKYHLGLEMLILGNKALNDIGIREIARPYLLDMRNKIDETVFLSVLNNNKVVCVEKFDTRKKLRYFVQVGNNMPFNCAASAKVIIAFQDQEALCEMISKMRFLRYTDSTLYEQEKLLLEYENVRKLGYAICNEEMENMVLAIAVPIFDYDNKVRSSICVLGLKESLKGERLNKIIDMMVQTANEVSDKWSNVRCDRRENMA